MNIITISIVICMVGILAIKAINTNLVFAQEGDVGSNGLDKKAYAISNNTDGIEPSIKSFNNLTIIFPIYEEHFKQVINQTANTESFSGHGILNGKIDVNVNATVKMIPLENMSVFISGKAEFTSNNTGDRAPYTFQEIGHYNKDGSFNSAGSIFFNSTTTTGELSFLKNTIGIFKKIVDKDGNGTFLMWRWN